MRRELRLAQEFPCIVRKYETARANCREIAVRRLNSLGLLIGHMLARYIPSIATPWIFLSIAYPPTAITLRIQYGHLYTFNPGIIGFFH